MTNYYTTKQLTEKLHVSPQTIRMYIREKKLKATKIGKHYLVSEMDLNNFFNNN